MKKDHELERWLRSVAQSAAMQQVLHETASAPLSEDLLVRYRAGLLTADEEKRIAPVVALNEQNLRFLAEMEGDIQHAAARTAPAGGLVARLADQATSFGAFWRTPYHAMRFAGAVAMVAWATLLFWPPATQMAPSSPAPLEVPRGAAEPPTGALPYRSPLLETLRGGGAGTSILLPGGVALERVDPDWRLHWPVGNVEDARRFSWSPLSGKDSYDFRLYADDGSIVLERTGLTEPELVLPAAVGASLEAGREYVWVVESAGDAESRVIRGVGRFTIVRG